MTRHSACLTFAQIWTQFINIIPLYSRKSPGLNDRLCACPACEALPDLFTPHSSLLPCFHSSHTDLVARLVLVLACAQAVPPACSAPPTPPPYSQGYSFKLSFKYLPRGLSWPLHLKLQPSWAHTCNPSYLGGWDWEDRHSRPTQANICETPISKITRAKWTGGVAQAVEWLLWSPGFKP
jgi:hypothetical protein